MTLKYKISNDQRCNLLKEKILNKGFVRIIEAHSGLSALIGQKAQVHQNGTIIEFDGFWESSLTDSASKGMPDAEIIGNSSRLKTIDEILSVTDKPIIVDGDTGGSPAQFEYLVKELQRIGVSAVIIEDKVFPKRNSLDNLAKQTQEDPEIFSQKIKRGIDTKISDDFMIIARIESLIAGVGLKDALNRASVYIESGVDGIMIHSKDDSPENILLFAEGYNKLCKQYGKRPVLVSVPTTYNLITDEELASYGFNIIIHANHLLRASHNAMKQVAENILLNDRNFEAEATCSTVPEIFEDVGFNWIKEQDKKYSKEQQLSVIIPAAGKDKLFKNIPKAMIPIANKPLINYQLEIIRKTGLRNISVITGYAHDSFTIKDVKVIHNKDFQEKHSLYSLFCAREQMENGFIVVFSDILFNKDILQTLLQTKGDIVLLVDSSYTYHKHDIDKKLDLVICKTKRSSYYRTLQPSMMNEIIRIGKQISKEEADYEFIGIAYFSKNGAEILKKVYDDDLVRCKGTFHEADSFESAGITDIIQEIIDLGFSINALEVYKGWMEIHTPADQKIAEQMVKGII